MLFKRIKTSPSFPLRQNIVHNEKKQCPLELTFKVRHKELRFARDVATEESTEEVKAFETIMTVI